ncbi:MAG: DUF1800 family protein [Saprospiraceae bacterium]
MASLTPLSGSLGRRRAAHLLRRSSFNYTKDRVDALATQTASQAVASLLSFRPQLYDQPYYDVPSTTGVVEAIQWLLPTGQTAPGQEYEMRWNVTSWWINEALHDTGIGNKMIFFWHQYLACDIIAQNHATFFDYLRLLRWGALGNFKKLATKIVTDNTMLQYLSNNVNTKTNPNENFAREFFELFTIGKGLQIAEGDYTHYTEDDIVKAARVFTGFRKRTQRDQYDPETGIPWGTTQISAHDTTAKTFSPKFQNTTIAGATTAAGMYTELNAFVNMIFAQPQVAVHICTRLYRYFVSPNITPEIEADIIGPLANTFRSNNYELLPVLQQLLSSEHFYDADDSDNHDEIIGGMIKSPLELSLQAISFFNVPIPNPVTKNNDHYIKFYYYAVFERMLSYANMALFFPPDVAGYAAYHQAPDYNRQWFNSSSIISRYKLPTILMSGKRSIGGGANNSIGTQLKIAEWVRDSDTISDPSDPFVLVTELLQYMLPEEPDTDRFDYFYNVVFLDNLPPADWTYEWQNYLSTGKGEEVTIALTRLVTYIMFSPEYQLL